MPCFICDIQREIYSIEKYVERAAMAVFDFLLAILRTYFAPLLRSMLLVNDSLQLSVFFLVFSAWMVGQQSGKLSSKYKKRHFRE